MIQNLEKISPSSEKTRRGVFIHKNSIPALDFLLDAAAGVVQLRRPSSPFKTSRNGLALVAGTGHWSKVTEERKSHQKQYVIFIALLLHMMGV